MNTLCVNIRYVHTYGGTLSSWLLMRMAKLDLSEVDQGTRWGRSGVSAAAVKVMAALPMEINSRLQ